MPPVRTLPVAATHRELAVKVGGQAVARQHQLLSATIVKAANRISSARLAYLDGAAASSDFPLSNAATFVPGSEVELLAGAAGSQTTLFKGIVVKVALKIRDHVAPQLIVECRHKATKLTVGRKNACFADQTDADILSAIIGDAGLTAEVESMSVTHSRQVQYRSTDWDFVLSRAAANGRLVFTNDDSVAIKAPSFSATPALTLQFGATMLELDAEIDARRQFAAVKGFSWDAAQQAIVESEASDPGVKAPGNLTTDDLSGVVALGSYDLRHIALPENEIKAWADAEWLQSKMNKVRGRVKCEGVADIKPGDMVTIAGAGDRVSGDVFVSGVRHDFDTQQGWKTHVQFGGVDPRPSQEASAPPAAALLPAVHGLQIGVVTSNEDPDGEHRVQVRLPLVDANDVGVWARVSSLDAGDDRGFFFRPEIGDEVAVGFLDSDPRRPIILGMLHSSAKAAPLKGSDDNHKKLYQSRSKMLLSFDDDKKIMRLETPAGNVIALNEEDSELSLTDQSGNTIKMTSSGITIESASKLTLKAASSLELSAGSSLSVKATGELKLEGSGAELSSAGVTKVKGGLVQIN